MPRIDTHHHYVPAKFRQYADKQSEWPSPQWTVESDRQFCQKSNIGFSILSLTTPGPAVAGAGEKATDMARDSNLRAKEIQEQYPGSYGFFASIPPPEPNSAALSELAFALDTLHADGVTLLTSYGGRYLGHSDFKPLWQELNARKAVVFVHPTSPEGWRPANDQLLAPLADFAWETTRCALDLILSDTVKSVPDCKIILSHAGGCLPWIWHRAAVLIQPFHSTAKSIEDIREEARSFWFDTALSGSALVMDLLIKFARSDRILYGSDYPYADEKSIEIFTTALNDTDLSMEMKEKVEWRNALELFPRLRTVFVDTDA